MPSEVICLGEALIDFLAVDQGMRVADAVTFRRAPGGAPANVAAGVARLGRSSAFLGKVGDDPFGRLLAGTFGECGVDISGMRFDPDHRTGLAFVSLDRDHVPSYCFFRNPSADMGYSPRDLDREQIASGRVFHCGSITLIDEPARSATMAALRMARGAGLLISCDPNLRPALWPDLETARAAIMGLLRDVDVVKMSAEELAFLFEPGAYPSEPSHAALHDYGAELLRLRPNIFLALITRGPGGCTWLHNGTQGESPGFAVETVDTVGAGDAFVAGLLVAMLRAASDPSARGRDLIPADPADIVRVANAVGALATTRSGAIPSLPTWDETEQFLASWS